MQSEINVHDILVGGSMFPVCFCISAGMGGKVDTVVLYDQCCGNLEQVTECTGIGTFKVHYTESESMTECSVT